MHGMKYGTRTIVLVYDSVVLVSLTFLLLAFFLAVKSGHCCTVTPGRLETRLSCLSSPSCCCLGCHTSRELPMPDSRRSPVGLNCDREMMRSRPGWWSWCSSAPLSGW